MKKGRRFGDIVSNVYLILLSIVAVFPLLWLLVSAFKSSSEMLNNPTKIWPIQWTLENFKTVLFTLKFTINIRNSLIIAGSTTVVAIIISSLAAYGVVRFFPKLGNVMTKILVTTYMFPSIMLVIPYAMVMAKLNLTNTRIGLMLVYLSFSVPYAVWMLVGFFKTVPIGIEEAARIDGANKLQVFVRIVLPLVSPGIVATAIYVFINAWNEYLYSMILMSSSDKTTISVAVKTLEGADILNWGALMAACAIVVVPSIIFFCFIQNKMAGHVMNFFHGVRLAKKFIQEGRIGKVLYAHSARNGWEEPQPSISWKKIRSKSGGHLYHHIHELDCIQFIMGPATRVTMTGGNVAHSGPEFGDEDDMLFLNLEFGNNTYAIVEYGSAFHWPEHYVLIQGTKGAIRIDMCNVGMTVKLADGTEEHYCVHANKEIDDDRTRIYHSTEMDGAIQYGHPGKKPPMWLNSIMNAEMEFFNGVMHGDPIPDEFKPLMTGEAARAAIATADAATLSLRENRKVSVEEVMK